MKKTLFGLACLLPLATQALEQQPTHEIAIEIKINCPESEELEKFLKSVPLEGNYSTDFEEWKASFVNNMTHLIYLVDSGKLCNSSWSVKVDENAQKEVEKD